MLRSFSALTRWAFRAAAAGAWCVLAVAPALAQAKKDAKSGPPYDVQGLEAGWTFVPWVFAFLFIALCAATCFKNPHRTNTRETS